ncbi:beta-CASP ribonuclease aCPSF1 [Candidatus Woesearchaeota archaeon]|nr:beta-CASP ribonuclease aCPSF1 [Candidatus Woesearchaeota archaeon]
MADIIKEILKDLPADKISDAAYEGANIVLYTKDTDFFLNNNGLIKECVDKIKKRIELRPDPSITMEQESAERIIRELLTEEAGIDQIIFDPQRSIAIIEAEKPGLAIGKQGSLLREIRAKTFWVPIIRRKPAIRSKLIESIRAVLYQNSDFRRKFLDRTGHRIYDGWMREKKHEWVRLTYMGAGRQVGRSCFLLQTPESRVLLDCGIDPAQQPDNPDAYPYLEIPEFKINELDAVVVSHAHLDHSALIPYLIKFGYSGPIYCTAPTRDVMALLQLDFIKIMRNEGKEPLYTAEEVKKMIMQCIILDYNEVADITPDMRVTMYNAGHILGSAMVHIHIGNGLHNLLYGADMKFGRTSLLEPAVADFPRLETLMIEATYGGKENILPTRIECEDHYRNIILNTIKRNGKVLTPVLGVGRAQEVMMILEEMVRTGAMQEIPVYIDGMVWDITAIHTAYPEFLNSAIRKLIFHKDNNPFLHPMFKRVGSQKERMELLENTGPCVILATSGMLVGGPSVEYFKHLANNPKNSITFVSYQGEGSLGRRVQRGEKDINMGSAVRPDMLKVNMEIHTIDGLTGHSGRNQLMSFIHKCNPKPKKVLIVHGESSRCTDLASSIHKQNRIETAAPRNLETIRLK